jgi:arylformamidase
MIDLDAARIIDISPPISPSLAVFPGDTPLSHEVLMDFERGHHIALSTLRATVHLGAHADAPSHYGRFGVPIDQVDPARFMGRCRVVQVRKGAGERVGVADLPEATWRAPMPKRLLVRTGTHPDPNAWSDAFAGLAPELIDRAAAAGVDLIGIDTPSIDPADSKDLEAHQRVYALDLLIVEGLVLEHVELGPAGVAEFTLVALPLRLVGFDASPVRAVLVAE